MRTLIQVSKDTCVIASKIVSFHIDKKDERKLIIWLEGGFTITNEYNTKEACKSNFDGLLKIIRQDNLTQSTLKFVK